MQNRFLRLYPSYAVVAISTLLIFWAFSWNSPGSVWPFEYWSKWGDSLSLGSLAAVVAANLLIIGQDMLMFFGVDPVSGSLYFTTDFAIETVPAYKFLFVPQAWTLGVELLFYLAAPLIVTRRMKTIFIVFTLGLVLRWYIMIRLGLQTDPWDYRFFPMELPLFLWGSLAYKVYAHFESRELLGRGIGTVALGLIFAGVLFNTELPKLLREGVLGLPIMCIALGPALPFLFHRTRHSQRDRWVGALSYPIYVVHLMVVMLLRQLEWTSNLGLSACVISILLALMLRKFAEAPVDRWRHKIPTPSESPVANRIGLAPV